LYHCSPPFVISGGLGEYCHPPLIILVVHWLYCVQMLCHL